MSTTFRTGRRRRAWSPVVLAVAMLGTACSSASSAPGVDEVAVDSAQDGSQALDDELLTEADPADGGGTETSSTSAGNAPGASPEQAPSGSESAAGSTGQAGPAGGAGSQGGTGSAGAGDTDEPPPAGVASPSGEPMLIGFEYIESLDGSIVGASPAAGDFGNAEQAGRALLDWINETGGIAGRPVEGIFHGTNLESSSWAAQGQAACAKFAEDNDVDVAVSGFVGGGAGSMIACLAQHDVPLIAPDRSPYGRSALTDYPDHLFLLGRLSMQTWGRAYIDGLHRHGWFDEGTFGLIRFDRVEFDRTMQDVVAPRLAELGIEPEVATVQFPTSAAGLGGASAQIQNAILRFRGAGVDKVLFLDWAGTLAFLFLPEAESQGYNPLYAFNTANGPSLMSGEGSPEQLEGTIGIGWNPQDDGYMSVFSNPSKELCAEVLDGVSAQEMWSYCGALLLLRESLSGATTLDTATLRAGIDSLGESFTSPTSHGTRFAPGRHEGPSLVHPFRYELECTCFRPFARPIAVD